MSRKTSDFKKRSGLEMRAGREQRKAELADPAAEAKRYEKSFLDNLSDARADYDWIVNNQAWRQLGFGSLGDWYAARVQPMLLALGARPNPEVGVDVALRILDEETKLPPAQRRTTAELAAIAGLSEKKLRRLASRSLPGPNGRDDDLASSSTIDGEFIEDAETKTRDAASETSVTAPETEPRAGTPDGSEKTGIDEEPVGGDGSGCVTAVPTQDTPAGHPAPADPARGSSPRSGQLGLHAASDVVPDAVPPARTGVSVAGDEPGEDTSSSSPGDPQAPEDPFTDWVWDVLDVIGRRPDPQDAADASEDVIDALVNGDADISEFVNAVLRLRNAS